MDHLYAEGTFIAAKNDPSRKLLIKWYLGRVTIVLLSMTRRRNY
jgi:hypothetical protein